MQHIFILGGRSLACEASTVKAQAGWHSLLTHDLATLMSASATGAQNVQTFLLPSGAVAKLGMLSPASSASTQQAVRQC